MDLQHEYNKIIESYNAKVIDKSRTMYELLKLEATAKKLRSKWQLPTSINISTTTQQAINEDYDELLKLRKAGILSKKRFDRDCIKIAALCEETGLNYPHKVVEDINVNIIAESIDNDGNEYEDMDEDDEYEDMDEDDEYGEDEEEDREQLVATMQLPEGSLEMWTINSETEYKLDGRYLEGYQLPQVVSRNINVFIDELRESMNSLKYVYEGMENFLGDRDGYARFVENQAMERIANETDREYAERYKNDFVTNRLREYDVVMNIMDGLNSGNLDYDTVDEIMGNFYDITESDMWNWL